MESVIILAAELTAVTSEELAFLLAGVRWAARSVLPPKIRTRLNALLQPLRLRFAVDRRYLEKRILPWLETRGVRDVLSIGCRAYTMRHQRMLQDAGAHLTTADVDPSAARFGARRHLVTSVITMSEADCPGGVDAILFNGVIGWGLNRTDEIEKAFDALARVARPGAVLVVGWNTDRSRDPLRLAAASRSFTPIPGPTGRSRVTFERSTHVYDFLIRRE